MARRAGGVDFLQSGPAGGASTLDGLAAQRLALVLQAAGQGEEHLPLPRVQSDVADRLGNPGSGFGQGPGDAGDLGQVGLARPGRAQFLGQAGEMERGNPGHHRPKILTVDGVMPDRAGTGCGAARGLGDGAGGATRKDEKPQGHTMPEDRPEIEGHGVKVGHGKKNARRGALLRKLRNANETIRRDVGGVGTARSRPMHRQPTCAIIFLSLFLLSLVRAAEPVLPGIGAAMADMVAKQEIAGAVTVVVTKDQVLHLESTGLADVASKRPMTPDTLFWIASMSKPVTGAAVLMLQDEGKLHASDLVAKHLPSFAGLKSPSGKPAHLTITQLLTHTSGLGEAGGPLAKEAKTLAELEPIWLAAPMQYEPGEKWKYTQSGINAAGRIVEVISGMSFDAFLAQRLFAPLGMKDTTFYPSEAQRTRLVTGYAKNAETGQLEPVPAREGYEGTRNRPPQGNGGLYSTPRDYARFCQMLLGGGTWDGHQYLSSEALSFLSTPQTGELPTGFFQKDGLGANYGWGLGTCVLRQPHEGVAAKLSPGTFGHGGAWGTQAWIDPVRGVAYILMIQRSNLPNSDGSEVRRVFQEAAANALAKP